MKYRDMTAEQKEAKKARMRKRYAEHQEEYKAYHRKYRAEHSEEYNARHRKYKAEHSEERKARWKKKYAEDMNKYGVSKGHIRNVSGRILEKVHQKLDGYEIHHCFGYEDPNRFIYIPKTLHTQIHRLLRERNISAESNHWNAIRDLVNSCKEYTYVRV